MMNTENKFYVIEGFLSMERGKECGNLFSQNCNSYLPFLLKFQKSTIVDLEASLQEDSDKSNASDKFRGCR